ncbi:MAG: Hsp20/alpha crystallin family protein [Candidatus Helarchaeota archaeon]
MADKKDLVKSDAYSHLNLMNQFDRIFEDFRKGFDDLFWGPTYMAIPTIRTPVVDILDKGDKYLIHAEMPGLDKEDVTIELNKNILEIKAEKKEEIEEKKEGYLRKERGYQSFYRQLALPEEIIADKIEAKLDKGILTITVPKKEPEPKKKIEIK